MCRSFLCASEMQQGQHGYVRMAFRMKAVLLASNVRGTKSETKGEATLSESESAPHMWRKTRVALMALSQAALLGWLARVRMSMQSMCSPGSWATLIVLRSAGHGAGNKNPMPVRLFRAKRYPSPCHETPVAMQIQMEA